MASTPATDDVVVVDPSYKWKWLEESDTYLLSLNDLPADLKLEDLLVRVNGKRRLTITDRRKPTPGGKTLRLNKKTFQLPKTANPDAITGCFNGGVLTLTVPAKGQQQPAPPAVAVAAKKEEEPKGKAEPEREKELIDTAVAAFTLGVLFSHRLFSSRN
ncbi:hypothetical protein BDA96_03G218500 [Sorghum bicolor]|uniref:SHSP domain-containing protein n=1 Tax=Sorghum bicolor TaxID=4558 RepID=A0A921UN03_SORBI|nr:hypothetical protein BDA96_03G218500 [Sorghum bicolor]